MDHKTHLRNVGLLAVAAVAVAPIATLGKPRLISVQVDGSTQEVTQGKKLTGKERQSITDFTSDTGSDGTGTTSGEEPIVSAEDPTESSGGYYSTLSPTYTPSQIGWNSRQWRVNSAATKYPNLDHSIRHSATWQKLRFEIRADDPQMESKPEKRRAELSGSVYGDPTRLPNGQSLWGAFSTVHHPWADPEGMRSTYGIVFGQIHMGSKVGGSPALAFRRKHDGQFRITTRGEFDNKGSVRFEGPLSFGQAHDFVYNIVLHPTKGRLRVWHNARLIVDAQGSIGHTAADSYWNVGVYAPGGVTSPVTLELGNHVYPAPQSLSDRTMSAPAWPSD